jgi:hypothetical protein
MLCYACHHLGIERLGRGNIDGLPRKGAGADFGVPAFSRPGSSSYQDDGHDRLRTSDPIPTFAPIAARTFANVGINGPLAKL